MEKEPFENKMMRNIKDMAGNANDMFNESMDGIDAKLKKEFGPKGYARFKAYQNKRIKLESENKMKEAEELTKIYLSGK